jgi:hypothetical protein
MLYDLIRTSQIRLQSGNLRDCGVGKGNTVVEQQWEVVDTYLWHYLDRHLRTDDLGSQVRYIACHTRDAFGFRRHL